MVESLAEINIISSIGWNENVDWYNFVVAFNEFLTNRSVVRLNPFSYIVLFWNFNVIFEARTSNYDVKSRSCISLTVLKRSGSF